MNRRVVWPWHRHRAAVAEREQAEQRAEAVEHEVVRPLREWRANMIARNHVAAQVARVITGGDQPS